MAVIQAKNENVKEKVLKIAKEAKAAAEILRLAETEKKNKALNFAAIELRKNAAKIIAANKIDLEFAKSAGKTKAMLDRLLLDEKRIDGIAKSLEEIAKLPEPVGKVLSEWERPNGLKISRVSVPLGVIGIIFEARPNVTADAGSLCLKSGNAAILRCGSESLNSSLAILECLQAGLKEAGLPENAIQLIPTKEREAVGEMLKLHEYIDIIVPRGGKDLIKRVMNESKIPVIKHLDGNCHTYIEKSAKEEMARKVLLNAKMRRTGICGATETLLIDEEIATKLLPKIAADLANAGCEMRGDKESQKIDSRIKAASEEDYYTEFLDSIIAIKIVKNVDEAISHINKYGSEHTDAIITENDALAEKFLNGVNSAIAVHNASTQFADGGEFGMGAEIGISTGKLHARGPVGVEQLTTYKYILKGDGQIRPV